MTKSEGMTSDEARTEQRVRGGASGQYHHGRRKEFPLPTTKEWGEGQGGARERGVPTAWLLHVTSPSPQPSHSRRDSSKKHSPIASVPCFIRGVLTAKARAGRRSALIS